MKDDQQSGAATLPPSHISQDGKFVHLPPPSNQERIRFFERSIARHGLLEADLKTDKDEKEEEEDESKKKDEPKVHPLALASARLQSSGINELNRAINLHSLAASGEYFGLSNIVDPALEQSMSEKTASDAANPSSSSASPETAAAPTKPIDEDDARTKALYILKRKRTQFEHAAATLKRHRIRTSKAVVAQIRPDQRLRSLRPQWRLVAPEHGTRALPHGARSTEIIAIDVDVYVQGSGLGRLASGVPRYATIELKEDYKVNDDWQRWNERHFPEVDTDAMEIDEPLDKKEDKAAPAKGKDESCTRAEPFTVLDPALGKVDTYFADKNVTMLTLQFDIEKPSTGFFQFFCLEPISSAPDSTTAEESNVPSEDEQLLIELQHSLFCAKLFESIRRELAPDTQAIGQVRTSAKAQSAVWLSGELEENFLPPPSQLIGGEHGELAPLCLLHVHEGDVKVLLDCEYALRVRLMEPKNTPNHGNNGASSSPINADSGSQSPAQLLTLCKALLLHAQESHHRHSVQTETKMRMEGEEKLRQLQNGEPLATRVAPVQTKGESKSPKILQNCVSLGTKILFERRIRLTLKKVDKWLKSAMGAETGDELNVEWLALSMFDLAAQFSVSFRSWSIDANIVCDELTVTRFGENGDYRKARFHSAKEFELYLKMALKRLLRR